jgi:hypothetical protein
MGKGVVVGIVATLGADIIELRAGLGRVAPLREGGGAGSEADRDEE